MKKNFKKALIVAPVACLALSLGAFAAACAPHEHAYEWEHDFDKHWQVCPDCPEPEEPQKTEHDFKGTANCECGAKRGKIDAIAPGPNEITVDGTTAVAFVVNSCGTYSMTVADLGDKAYTITVNGTDYSVNKTNPKFVFNIEAGSKVEVFNPDGIVSAGGTGSGNPNERDGEEGSEKLLSQIHSGVRIKITPAADYSEGEVKDVVKFNIDSLSQMLKTGNNAGSSAIDVSQPIMHTYSGSTYGEYTFDFDIKDDVSEYTVEIAGQTKTVNKTNPSFKINLQAGDGLAQQKANGMYAIKFTPKAGSAQTVDCYIVKPEQVGSFTFGDTAGVNVNYDKDPEIFDYYHREYEFKVKNTQDRNKKWNIVAGNEYAFAGTAYYSNFELYMGSAKVGEVTDVNTKNEEAKNFVIKFTINAADLVENEVSFKIVFTGTTTNYAVLGGVTNPPKEVDNSKLNLVNGISDDGVTTVKEADKNDNKYTYTFTAPEDGWYAVRLFGNGGVNYAVGSKNGKLLDYEWNDEVFELAKDEVLTLVLTDGTVTKNVYDPNDLLTIIGTKTVTVTPVDTVIAVIKTVKPVNVPDVTNQLALDKTTLIDFTDVDAYYLGLSLTFTAEKAGTYELSLPVQDFYILVLDEGGMDAFNILIGQPDVGDFISSYKFTLKAGETITFVFAYNTFENDGPDGKPHYEKYNYVVRIVETVPDVAVVTVANGAQLTKPGKFEVEVEPGAVIGATTSPVTCTFKPETAGTYKITSLDTSEYFTVSVGGEQVIYYEEEYVSVGTIVVPAEGVTLVLDADSGVSGTYEFTIELVA